MSIIFEELIKQAEAGEKDGAEYKAYFAKKLAAAGYTSPGDIPADKKKAFFDSVDKGWSSDTEDKKDVEKKASENKYLKKVAALKGNAAVTGGPNEERVQQYLRGAKKLGHKAEYDYVKSTTGSDRRLMGMMVDDKRLKHKSPATIAVPAALGGVTGAALGSGVKGRLVGAGIGAATVGGLAEVTRRMGNKGSAFDRAIMEAGKKT